MHGTHNAMHNIMQVCIYHAIYIYEYQNLNAFTNDFCLYELHCVHKVTLVEHGYM